VWSCERAALDDDPRLALGLLLVPGMTRSYRRRAITEPIAIITPRPRPAEIEDKTFTCFRIVRALDDSLTSMELSYSSARMFAFVTR